MQDMLEFYIRSIQDKYHDFSYYQDYHLFTLLCIKYYFYSETNIPFDPEIISEYLTDGPNDGGIDAIFNDPNSEGNDVIILQSKYYKDTNLRVEDVIGELYKINETLKKLQSNKVSNYNEKLIKAYREATSQKEDIGQIRIYFLTSYQPKNKRERNRLEKSSSKYFNDYDFEINFKDDIEAQIELCENGKLCVDSDRLEIDKKDNFLEYENSVIVNISALSLQKLQNRRRNGLLGKNLRFYIRKKDVDNGIEKTIKSEPENFWYKNNGILVICENYDIDGKILKLKNFSIVNGGQTTNRIGKIDIEKDFYLQCKVVKIKGKSEDEKDKFVYSIAESTNSQKPIKKADLKANSPEQLKLRERLNRYHVYYMTKKGDKVPKQYSEPYQSATLEQIGKLGLAAILQMPGSARSNSQRMYNDNYYYIIFGFESKEGILVDLLKISYYYQKFLKYRIKGKGYDEKTSLPMIKNGRTYQYACIVLLCKLCHEIFSYSTIAGLLNDTDALKDVLKNVGDMKRLILKNVDNEEDLFFDMFDIIGDEVLGYCFENALEKAETEQKTLAPSDYLKSDANYYKDIIKRLWRIYNKNMKLKNAIYTICNKS